MAKRIVGGAKRAASPSPSPSPQPKPTPGQTAAKAVNPINRPAPTPQRQVTTLQRGSGTQGAGGPWTGGGSPDLFSGGGDPFGGGGPMVSAPSDEDYLAGDSGYQTQLSALTGALQRYLADSDFQRTNYQTDYTRSLRDLGLDEGSKTWNWNDKLTASGRGYQNQLDDFASRGMLQSQGYADAFSELQRMLGQQYDAMSGARNTFMTDLDNQTANYKAENTANQQAARAEALQRRAAQYGM